jgi:predicted DNA-binding transcriptional regulator YafY
VEGLPEGSSTIHAKASISKNFCKSKIPKCTLPAQQMYHVKHSRISPIPIEEIALGFSSILLPVFPRAITSKHLDMPLTKNALIRFQTLDRCLRNTGRIYFWEDLLEECNRALLEYNPLSDGIQRRQLYDDIKYMESQQGWGVELAKTRHGRRVSYRYENPSFSINNQPLNDSEAEQIKAALQIISRFSGTPQFEWVNEMIPMLESKFGFIGPKTSVMSFEANVDLKGLHLLTPLFNAIVNERVLTVTYQDFKSKESYEITFHPYYLKQYNSRWFCFGMNAENRFPNWNLALDRIDSIVETGLKYQPCDIDWEEYFYDIIGVTRPVEGELTDIVLRFIPDAAPYVTTKPLHPSQRQKTDESGLEVRLKVIPNFELEKLIISFGEQVVVVSPLFFRDRISQRLKQAALRWS